MGQEQIYVIVIVLGFFGIFYFFKYILASIIRFIGREAKKGWDKD